MHMMRIWDLCSRMSWHMPTMVRISLKNMENVADFSTVAALYMEQVQIVTLDPSIQSVADLEGKKCFGRRGGVRRLL